MQATPCFLATATYSAKNRGGGVDGHGGGDAFEGNLIEQRFHVFQGIDGDADLADFAEGEWMIGVHANLRGQIERNGQTRLSFAPADSDSARWIPRRYRSRHIAAWSRDGRDTWSG